MTDAHPPVLEVGPDRSQPARVKDIVASLILLALGVVGIVMLAFVSLFLAMASDGCGSETNCDFTLMGVGYFVALLGPPLVYIAAGIATVVRLTRRRTAWWMPVAGAAVALAVWAIGLGMLMASLNR
jgi:uncharacterized BrkB/YihY/UPF0761 family membrane protein